MYESGNMTVHQLTETAAPLLRVALGILFLAHSIVLKPMTFGLAGPAAFLCQRRATRLACLCDIRGGGGGRRPADSGRANPLGRDALLPALIGAAIWVHTANGPVFAAPNGGWEYPAFVVVVSIVQLLLGDGAYALARSKPISHFEHARAA
jgi:putative oxidoreductase